MTLEDKVGQILVIGFDGETMDGDLRAMIQETGVGGVIFFARNVRSPGQVAALAAEMQDAARAAGRPGLLVAVDQEGGRVARLTGAAGFTEFPGAMALAAGPDPAQVGAVAEALAVEMRAVGINVDFAPDLDVNNNPDNPVIGLRSFGSDPAEVGRLGAAFIEGLQRQGVMAFGKHFPGHGDTAVDSHVGLPLVAHDRARLEAVEFAPFRAAIQAGAAGIMSAHVTFPAIAPDGMPATLSPEVMTGLLREEMGYTGLLVTDSLEMGALGQSGYPAPEAAVRAFAAGADLLLFNRDHALHRQAYARVLEAVSGGAIPMERLDAAVLRVLEAKARFGLLGDAASVGDPTQAGSAAHRHLARAAARSAVTLVRDEAGLLPFDPAHLPLVVQFGADLGVAQRIGAPLAQVSDSLTPAETEFVLRAASADPGRPVLVLTHDAKTNPDQVALVQALHAAGLRVAVAALRNPYDLMAFPEIPTYIVTYGANPPMLDALAETLVGSSPPAGRLPVDLPGLYPRGHGLQGYPAR
jgi:beta-N-acetylhexosaminidase